MRWNKDSNKRYTESFEWWTPWFAWYPVNVIEDEWVWLETVGRKRVNNFWENDWIYSKDSSKRRD